MGSQSVCIAFLSVMHWPITAVITGIVIFGLPGEGRSEMEDTIRLLSDLQVEGIKLHHLYIVKNTELNRLQGW